MQLLVSRKEKIYMNSRIRKAVSALSCIALLVAALLGAFPLEVSAAAAPYAVSDAYAASVYYQRLNCIQYLLYKQYFAYIYLYYFYVNKIYLFC